MPPRTWIRIPRSLAREIPPRGPVELWLQHDGCYSQVSEVKVEVVDSGDVFMTQGWGAVARACRSKGALAIHFEYDGASMMFFKVFDEEGRRLECCPGGGRQDGAAVGASPALDPAGSSSSSSDGAWESSDSPDPDETPETSDDSYVPLSSRRARGAAAASARRRH